MIESVSPADLVAPTTAVTPATSPTAAIVDPVAAWPSCQNYALNYEVAYPPDWYTADPNDQLNCRFFGPEPLSVTSDSPLPKTAIRIYVSQNSYARLDSQFDPQTNSYVLHRDEVTVGGNLGFSVEVETTDGKVAYAYVIDVGGQAFVVDTFEDYSPDYATAKSYVDLMASSLRFLSGDAG